MSISMLAGIAPWNWPPDAADLLLVALRDRGVERSERLLAAELASDITVMNDALAGALLDLLRDPDEEDELRAQAAISFGPTLEELDMHLPDDPLDELEEPLVSEATAQAIRAGLREVCEDGSSPKEVRRRALEGSVRALADWHARVVRAAYYSGDDEWKVTALFCMGHMPGFDDEIVEALESEDPKIRFEALRAASSYGPAGAWPYVRAILADRGATRDELLAAIPAAAAIRPHEAALILSDYLDSRDEEIADAASEALAMARVDSELDHDDEP